MLIGAILVGQFVLMAILVINSIRLENEALKEAEKRRHQGWNWD